jgi:hypothetical protein
MELKITLLIIVFLHNFTLHRFSFTLHRKSNQLSKKQTFSVVVY